MPYKFLISVIDWPAFVKCQLSSTMEKPAYPVCFCFSCTKSTEEINVGELSMEAKVQYFPKYWLRLLRKEIQRSWTIVLDVKYEAMK